MMMKMLMGLGIIFFSISSFALTPAGKVVVSTGIFQEIHSGQGSVNLSRGNDFYTGDILKTGPNSTAQIRFTDGTVMALNPNSQIKIDDYQFEKKANSDKNFITLAQGGFRAISGLINKINPNAYHVNTPVAIIGVRGTDYGVILDKNKLYSGVWKGIILVKNSKGQILLGQGQPYSFSETSLNQESVGLLNPPSQLTPACQSN